MAQKSYLDLKSEVWDTGICSGCGACVAVCPADAISFKEGEMVTSPVSNGYCKQATDSVPCGACYAACPRTTEQPQEELGDYLEMVAAKAVIDVPTGRAAVPLRQSSPMRWIPVSSMRS